MYGNRNEMCWAEQMERTAFGSVCFFSDTLQILSHCLLCEYLCVTGAKKSAVSSSHGETARCRIACFDRTASRVAVLLVSDQHPV